MVRIGRGDRRRRRRKRRRRIGGRPRRKRVRFVVHSVGVSFEWQIDNWSLLSYDWALLSRYFCVHSSPHLLFGPLPWTLSETSSAAPWLGYRLRGSQVTRVTWTPAASVAHSSILKSYSSMRASTIILGWNNGTIKLCPRFFSFSENSFARKKINYNADN